MDGGEDGVGASWGAWAQGVVPDGADGRAFEVEGGQRGIGDACAGLVGARVQGGAHGQAGRGGGAAQVAAQDVPRGAGMPGPVRADRPDQVLQRRPDGWRFGSTGGRPPPDRRCRCTGAAASAPATSAWPRRIVVSSRPVIWATRRTPPRPRRCAATAAYHRRSGSPRRLSRRFIGAWRTRVACASPAWQPGHWQTRTAVAFIGGTRPTRGWALHATPRGVAPRSRPPQRDVVA
jgi:hypothetical protein